MYIYKKNRTESYYYRKIYSENYGNIPTDEDGRTFDIHHLDGNTENNHPSNLIAVSITEHYEIHKKQGDVKACLAIAARMKISPEEKKKIASEANTGSKNPSYGSKWWNNGIIEVRTKIKPIGDNWIPGRFGIAKKINDTKNKNGSQPVGKNNGRFDHRIHKFINLVTGEIVSSTQYDFIKKYQLCRRSINRIVDGSKNKYKNWTIER